MRKVLRKYLERIPLFTVFCGKSTSPLVCNENFLLTKTALFMKTTRGEGGDPLDKYLRWIIIKKDTGDTSVFFCEFCKLFKKTFFTENLQFTVSVFGQFQQWIQQKNINGYNALAGAHSGPYQTSVMELFWENT